MCLFGHLFTFFLLEMSFQILCLFLSWVVFTEFQLPSVSSGYYFHIRHIVCKYFLPICRLSFCSFFFFKKYSFIYSFGCTGSFLFPHLFLYLFLAVLGLYWCTWAFSTFGEQGLLFVAVLKLLLLCLFTLLIVSLDPPKVFILRDANLYTFFFLFVLCFWYHNQESTAEDFSLRFLLGDVK